MSRRRLLLSVLLVVALGILVLGTWRLKQTTSSNHVTQFDGERAYQDVRAQVAFGPRTVGSEAHRHVIDYVFTELAKAGWRVKLQTAEVMGHQIQNMVARRDDTPPDVIVGAHYDSRLLADQDPAPDQRKAAVPGANDGASGVAVLLGLARALPVGTVPIELVFFDAEDNGNIPGWDWLLGSQAYVLEFDPNPRAMVLVDMVGDSDLSLPLEQNSDSELAASIWETASRLGYGDVFVMRRGPHILDDHVPFIQAGIPSADIIDIDYPYWHTTADTVDKVSAQSLQVVGDTLLEWLISYPQQPQ